MRIIRVKHQGKFFYASLDASGEKISCLQPNLGYSQPLDLAEVELAPLAAPSKIICIGLNYRDHAAELQMPLHQEPVFFLKPPSSLIADGESILIPPGIGRIDYEAELAIVIGQSCRNVSPEEAAKFVFGYSCANDVTARDLQKGANMMGRCKGYDTFCPLGPWLETEAPAPGAKIRTLVNGQVRQEGNLGDMIVKPLELISYLSGIMTLLPGDIILSGTPCGIGPIVPGDSLQIEIDGVGQLRNEVRTASQPEPKSQPGRLLQ